MNYTALQDLAVLIDIFCLYDHAQVLGRGVGMMFGGHSDLLAMMLTDEKFIDEQSAFQTSEEKIRKTAREHLAMFLDEADFEVFQKLLDFALEPGEVFALEYGPDTSYDLEMGEMQLKTLPSYKNIVDQLKVEQDALRGTAFLVRTFLYYAYADRAKIAFTPDTVRTPILRTILDQEKLFQSKLLEQVEATHDPSKEQYRGELLETLRSAHAQAMRGDTRLLSRVSPLASIVFMRASPKKERIVHEMQQLRHELAHVRKNIRDIEDKRLYGQAGEVVAANQRWDAIVNEIRRDYGGETLIRTFFRYGVNMGELGTAISQASLTSPLSLFNVLINAPKGVVDDIMRLWHRRPVIEIHKGRRALKGTGALRQTIGRLFGPIERD